MKVHEDGRVYEGEWFNDSEGKGKIMYPDGKMWIGGWKDNRNQEKRERKAIFDNGTLVKWLD